MGTELLEYIGPFDEVEIAATGDIVKHGETVEVAAELAGSEPDPHLTEAHEMLAALIALGPPVPASAVLTPDEHAAIAAYDEQLRALHAEVAAIDQGSGLLAQPDNWRRASKSAKARAAKAAPEPTPDSADAGQDQE